MARRVVLPLGLAVAALLLASWTPAQAQSSRGSGYQPQRCWPPPCIRPPTWGPCPGWGGGIDPGFGGPPYGPYGGPPYGGYGGPPYGPYGGPPYGPYGGPP